MKKLVIGFGNGRSGTASLTAFLNKHEGFNISHEDITLTENPLLDSFELQMMRLKHYEGDVVGDIGWYWFYYADRFVGVSKILYIWRDPEEVANSFWEYYKIPALAGFHKKNPEGLLTTFPWYCEEPTRDGILRTVRQYHTSAKRAAVKHPKHIFVMETKDLNDEEKLNDLCDYVEIPEEKRILEPVHINTLSEKAALMEDLYGNLDNREVRGRKDNPR